MTSSDTTSEEDKALLSYVQLWMSRLQLVMAVVSERSLTDRERADDSLLTGDLSAAHI